MSESKKLFNTSFSFGFNFYYVCFHVEHFKLNNSTSIVLCIIPEINSRLFQTIAINSLKLYLLIIGLLWVFNREYGNCQFIILE